MDKKKTYLCWWQQSFCIGKRTSCRCTWGAPCNTRSSHSSGKGTTISRGLGGLGHISRVALGLLGNLFGWRSLTCEISFALMHRRRVGPIIHHLVGHGSSCPRASGRASTTGCDGMVMRVLCLVMPKCGSTMCIFEWSAINDVFLNWMQLQVRVFFLE